MIFKSCQWVAKRPANVSSMKIRGQCKQHICSHFSPSPAPLTLITLVKTKSLWPNNLHFCCSEASCYEAGCSKIGHPEANCSKAGCLKMLSAILTAERLLFSLSPFRIHSSPISPLTTLKLIVHRVLVYSFISQSDDLASPVQLQLYKSCLTIILQ